MRSPIAVVTLIVLGSALVVVFLGCGLSGPEPRPELSNRDEDEAPIATHVDCANDELTATLSDGTRITFERVWTHDGFFDESEKTLTVAPPQRDPVRLTFGRTHGGYSTAEIRTNAARTRFWVLDLSPSHRHLTSGAAIDIDTARTYPEQFQDWPAPWARPDSGFLVARRTFGSERCPGSSPRPRPAR